MTVLWSRLSLSRSLGNHAPLPLDGFPQPSVLLGGGHLMLGSNPLLLPLLNLLDLRWIWRPRSLLLLLLLLLRGDCILHDGICVCFCLCRVITGLDRFVISAAVKFLDRRKCGGRLRRRLS